MKAAQIVKYGGKEVVQINDSVEMPVAAPGQLVIAVYAAAVNPFDITVREGLARKMAELQFPAIPGGDASGVVYQIGADVTGFEIGEEVFGVANALSSRGSFAEFTAIAASQLAKKPKSINFMAAAALATAGTSAYQALVEHIGLKAGQKILIHGGAGGIGSAAIQIAKTIGAHVATTVSARDTDFADKLGADQVIDYHSQNFGSILKDYDAVLDTVGGDTNLRSYRVLKAGGTLVSMLEPAHDALVAECGIKYISQFTKPTSERLTNVAELIEAGNLNSYIDKIFKLEQAAEALEYLKIGHPQGKVIIVCKEFTLEKS